MSLSMYHVTSTVTDQMLSALNRVIEHGEALVESGTMSADDLMAHKFTEDMFDLSQQVWRACDHARAIQRLAGVEVPLFDQRTPPQLSIQEAKDLIAKTLSDAKAITVDQLEGSEERVVEIIARGNPVRFKGEDYLLRMAIPQITFHVTTAYDLVRQAGAELGKRFYLGNVFEYVIE